MTFNHQYQPKAQYSSRIIKAGALVADTKKLLCSWNLSVSTAENIKQFHRENIFGKSSRSRVADILAIFRQRYLSNESVTKALILFARSKFSTSSLIPLLYFHSSLADRLLFDVATNIIFPMYKRGLVDINRREFQYSLTKMVKEGKMASLWSENTFNRLSSGLLSTLRDFGVLQGCVNKKISPAYLPIESFAYIIFYLKQSQASGVKLLELADWRLFLLFQDDVERLLFECHQRKMLEYHVAGSVTRLTFPAKTLEEYADVLAQR
ncbi:DUF1819 family protein [Synechococcus sp. PCC 6312]|uniref:DUF1819 family protein n=1 Tax=Synechococcus sp. (strain ATCC 27167 / PCC 6312) TaxID=195253 RepID=UPI00029ED7A1|nr:DUF1819 family protein [Synechococcus sp. PCC 6312]AFY60109.1 Putative inner membrane protein (DUF1819) [Synechococcus sp. PCC 6312]